MELIKELKVPLIYAERDMKLAQWMSKGNFYAQACYFAFRASQEALKRYLESKGENLGLEFSAKAAIKYAKEIVGLVKNRLNKVSNQ